MNHERKAQRDIERLRRAGQDGEPPVQYLDPQAILLVLWKQNEELRQRVADLERLVTPVR